MKNKDIHMRIADDTLARIDERADELGLTRTSFITFVMELYIAGKLVLVEDISKFLNEEK